MVSAVSAVSALFSRFQFEGGVGLKRGNDGNGGKFKIFKFAFVFNDLDLQPGCRCRGFPRQVRIDRRRVSHLYGPN